MTLKVRRFQSTLFFLFCVALAGILPAATPPAAPPALRISSEITLPASLEKAKDVRWAGDNSVYLALATEGAVEINLNPKNLATKEMIPGSTKPGGFWGSEQLAASPRFLVAAGPALSLTWRRLDVPVRVEQDFEGIQAIDVREDRLAILGVRRDENRKVGTDGAIAWTASLGQQLEDVKPFLYDVTGPGAKAMRRCIVSHVGAMRFLADGSLAVVPGVQPGVHLYDPKGNLVRTWDTASLGIDTDCQSLSEQQATQLISKAPDRYVWLNQRKLVDTLLPLDQGPGLVVRRVENGQTRWDLKQLRYDGSVETYEIPIEGRGEFFNLEGDVRSGRIVLLLKETVFQGERRAAPRLFVAHLPPK